MEESKEVPKKENVNPGKRKKVIKRALKKLEESKKLQIRFCITSVLVLIVLYIPLFVLVDRIAYKNQIIKRDVSFEESLLSNVDNISQDRGVLNISGWVLKQNAEIVDVVAILKSEGASPILLNTEVEENGNAGSYIDYFEMGEDVKGVNFVASIDATELSQDISYAVLLNVKYREANEEKEQKISTLSYIFNNQKYSYEPEKYDAPVFENEHMRDVVEKSQMLAHSIEDGAWVYLYDGSIYWVFDTTYEWNRNENLYVFLHMSTFAKNKLPQERKEYGFDNRDFFLKDEELVLENEQRYRVARMEINTEYPIVYLTTGHYDMDLGNRWSVRFLMLP